MSIVIKPSTGKARKVGAVPRISRDASTGEFVHTQVPTVNAWHRWVATDRSKYLFFFRCAAAERIDLIRHGVEAVSVRNMSDDLGLAQKEFLSALRISQATVSRKISEKKPLSPPDSEKVLGVASLVGQVQTMISDSGGEDEFDAAGWVGRWLTEPHRALGGSTPLQFLDTNEGLKLVSDLLSRQQSGAYS
ncbi:DUF2384 domain-containing protein [Asticcacaulis sp. BYS171W]|uniref:DUF2384 domain-containing protein n=1 Tax=Asticcacaulis aquaticus TaxID=2984212 RepID=A0ABT5HWS7_9CAUL|nr:antitoxin Xre-like helix-turn-helix domain-containing protein [Asticcacaulis aquaticus]MDC7684383.1 DUF2384 domain-containing protein [Asticcacaulis aquaticus]